MGSKPVGCGAPERNWADVKNVWSHAKATMTEERVEKKTRIYSSARRDPDLNEDVMDKPHIYTFWTKEDEEFELKLREHLVTPEEAPLVSRHFSNYVEDFEGLLERRYVRKEFFLSCLTYFFAGRKR